MSESPWQQRPRRPEPEPDPQRPPVSRFLIWLVVMLVGIIALVELSRLFPDARHGENADTSLVQNVLYVGVILTVAVFGARQVRWTHALRNIAAWLGIGFVLVAVYAYQDELLSVVGRVRSELIPGYAVASTPHEVVITQGEGDSFYVKGEVDGTTVFFAVDTGASDVTLTPADARRLGLDPDRLVYDRKYESANGAVFGAPYLIKSLTIGGITLNNVEASVNHADMSNSLLGLSFLRRLKSFEVRGRRLYLRS